MLWYLFAMLFGAMVGAGGLLTAQWVKDLDGAVTGGKFDREAYDRGWTDGYEAANAQHREARRQAGIKAGQTRKAKGSAIIDVNEEL
jgi:hypothetical protein